MPSPAEIELSLVSALIQARKLEAVSKTGLESDDFADEACKALYEYLVESELASRPFPSASDVGKLFSVQLDLQARDAHGLAERVHNMSSARKVKSALSLSISKIDEDPKQASSEIISQLSRLHLGKGSTATGLFAGGELRHRELLKRAKMRAAGKLIGWPYGFEGLEQNFMGLQDGEFFTILGRTGMGKSWTMLKVGISGVNAGARVLCVSPEMPKFETEMRADILRMGAEGYEIDFHALLAGDVKQIERYRIWLKGLELENDRWFTIDSDESGGFTIGVLFDLVNQHQPDILLVDGFHLLHGARHGSDDWSVIKQNADGLKLLLNMKGISLVTVMQVQRGVGEESNPGNDQTAYGKAIIEASDRVISIAGVRGHRDRRSILETKRRNRPPLEHRFYALYDLNRGVIRQLSSQELGLTEEDI